MNKLSNKFIAGISFILVIICISSLLFLTLGLERFYLYQKKTAVTAASDTFTKEFEQGTSYSDAIEKLEETHHVIIAAVDHMDMNVDTVNDELRTAFQRKGIGFQKYWLWEEDYAHILEGEHKIRLYKQEHLNYSLLVEYLQMNDQLFAVTMIIPNIADAFGIIHRFLIAVNVIGIAVAVSFIILYVKKITKPLQEFETFASQMKHNKYIPLHIHTKDELSIVANSLNTMGAQMIAYQESLQEKNRQMEQLLSDVAHDLKTPIALIQLYISGIQDGMDDGTFLETILMKNQEMADMVDQLLYVSSIKDRKLQLQKLSLSDLLQQIIKECSILAQERSILFQCDIEKEIMIESSEELMKSLLMNLINNAVKYSSGSQISILLDKYENKIVFAVRNETDQNELDLTNIWTPYYVGEQSRNKHLSGTGLGLVIVKNICDKLNYTITCAMEDGEIVFTLVIPVS